MSLSLDFREGDIWTNLIFGYLDKTEFDADKSWIFLQLFGSRFQDSEISRFPVIFKLYRRVRISIRLKQDVFAYQIYSNFTECKNLKRCFWRRVLHQKRFSSLTQGTEGCFVTVFVVVVVDVVVVVAVVVVVDVVVGVFFCHNSYCCCWKDSRGALESSSACRTVSSDSPRFSSGQWPPSQWPPGSRFSGQWRPGGQWQWRPGQNTSSFPTT